MTLPPTSPVDGPIFEAGGRTHVGGVRQRNEDSFLIAERVCAVADGMGGHAAGDVASQLVTRLVAEVFEAHGLTLDELPDFVSALNAAVLRTGAENGTRTMGTTLVGVARIDTPDGGRAVVFNVGDSRGYRLANGQLVQLTKDHSHVQDLVDGGHITPAEAETHPMRNVITRALGAEERVEADYFVLPPGPCRLLLCSDGLSGEVSAEQINGILKAFADPATVATRLVNAVLNGPAADNVTAVVVDVDESMSIPTSSLPPPDAAGITAESPFAPPVLDDRPWGPPTHPAAAPPGEAPW